MLERILPLQYQKNNYEIKIYMINRIILIGNGFDLAHGMKTGYKDFIKDYWNNQFKKYFDCNDDLYTCDEFEISTSFKKDILTSEAFHTKVQFSNTFIKNSLLLELSKNFFDADWVDIEGAFYRKLVHCQKSNNDNSIKQLNKDFNSIKILLEIYLAKEVKGRNVINNQLHETIYNHFNSPLNFDEISEDGLNKISDQIWGRVKNYEEFRNKTIDPTDFYKFEKDIMTENYEISRSDVPYILRGKSTNEDINKTIFTFNYTNTEKFYSSDDQEDDVIHIHGEINNIDNPIIFGYGDEIDDNYPEIEKLQNNDYLQNIKSINYSTTDNYKNLLRTINGNYYQVYIVGHSCGNTDRTLLNTIFEHDNCLSVKVFYHQHERGDNYLDIYKNISRNFNDKRKLRDRVVNKQMCSPLLPYEKEITAM